MSTKLTGREIRKKEGTRVAVVAKRPKGKGMTKFSPAWVVVHFKDAPGYNLELITRIRNGVKKSDWKNLIVKIGHSEKELEHVLPASISSMQKKSVYGKETSERIYELAKLYSLGYEVFDSKDSFKEWLMSPSKSLGGKKPFDLLDSSFGFQVVENEIVRVQYNVYS
jgi:putative toxin-antitoxin system antitoxin component (TIGR02293 family)